MSILDSRIVFERARGTWPLMSMGGGVALSSFVASESTSPSTAKTRSFKGIVQ